MIFELYFTIFENNFTTLYLFSRILHNASISEYSTNIELLTKYSSFLGSCVRWHCLVNFYGIDFWNIYIYINKCSSGLQTLSIHKILKISQNIHICQNMDYDIKMVNLVINTITFLKHNIYYQYIDYIVRIVNFVYKLS